MMTDMQLNEALRSICGEVAECQRIGLKASRRREELYTQAEHIFAQSRGWRVGEKSFGWRDLVAPGRVINDHESPPGADHLTYFFDHNGLPAAIMAQPYGYWGVGAGGPDETVEGPRLCKQWAERRGLAFESPNAPSWYYPGESVLALWLRRDLTRPARPLINAAPWLPYDWPEIGLVAAAVIEIDAESVAAFKGLVERHRLPPGMVASRTSEGMRQLWFLLHGGYVVGQNRRLPHGVRLKWWRAETLEDSTTPAPVVFPDKLPDRLRELELPPMPFWLADMADVRDTTAKHKR